MISQTPQAFPRSRRGWNQWLCLGVCAVSSACSLPSDHGPAGDANVAGDHKHAAAANDVAVDAAGNVTTVAVTIESLAPDKHLPFKPCLEQALKHNLKAAIARMATQVSAQEEQVASAAFDPVIRFNGITYPDIGTGWDSRGGNAMVKKKFITGAELRAEAGTAFSNNNDRGLDYMPRGTEHVVRLTQPLLRGAGIGVNRAPIDLARIITSSSSATARAEVMEMLRATESAYWTVGWAKESLRVQNESLGRSQRILADVQEKHRLGAATKIDQLEADAAVAAAREQVERASQRYSDAVSNLIYLLGLVPGSIPEGMTVDHLKVPENRISNPEGSYQQALRLNPQEVLLANEVERRSIESRVARNAVLPAVNLEVSNGSSGLIGFDGQTSSGKPNESSNWSAMLQVSIPWTSRAERAQAEQARLQLERSELAREDGRRQLRRDIFETAREIESGRRQLDAATEGERVNRAKWEEQMHRQQEGIVSVRDLREAEAELQQASLRALTAQLGVLVADARLARLDGSILQRNDLTF
ncbi:MAG: transporter [Verrucomicrobiaceae bacterium]|nr:transporter [Verrucomicrobiaceae bacterium]